MEPKHADDAVQAIHLRLCERAQDLCSYIAAFEEAAEEIAELQAENARLFALLNTPEIENFAQAVTLEAAHQRERWGEAHDANKTDEDWFWVIGYLASKALHTPIAKDHDYGLTAFELRDKRLHRIVTIAAAAANWHAQVLKRNV